MGVYIIDKARIKTLMASSESANTIHKKIDFQRRVHSSHLPQGVIAAAMGISPGRMSQMMNPSDNVRITLHQYEVIRMITDKEDPYYVPDLYDDNLAMIWDSLKDYEYPEEAARLIRTIRYYTWKQTVAFAFDGISTVFCNNLPTDTTKEQNKQINSFLIQVQESTLMCLDGKIEPAFDTLAKAVTSNDLVNTLEFLTAIVGAITAAKESLAQLLTAPTTDSEP